MLVGTQWNSFSFSLSSASNIRGVKSYGCGFLQTLLSILERLINQFLDERRVGSARKVLDGFAVAEEREGRSSHDPVAFGGELALDDVQSREPDFTFVLLRVLDEIRFHLLAVDAGGAVEYHEHGQLRKLYLLLPTAIVHFQQVHLWLYHCMPCWYKIWYGILKIVGFMRTSTAPSHG